MPLLLLLLVCAGALRAQSYSADRITNDFAGKDISATGVKLIGNGGVTWGGDYDEGHVDDYPIGFSFEFYGQSYTTVDICTNGWISFNPIAGTLPYMPSTPPSQSVPNSNYPNGIIAAGWQDLWGYVMGSNDGMYVQTLGTAPNREFRVEFRNMTKRQMPGGTMSFLWVLYEGSNRIEIHYGAITAGTPFGCGIENQAGTDGTPSPDGWLLIAPATCGYAFYQTPEIDLERAGATIACNATDNAGAMTIGVPCNLTYTVFNRGGAPLNISGVSFGSPANCTTTLVTTLPAVIAPGAQADFQVELTPLSAGACTCLLQIASDDADESPYPFTIAGNASPPPAPEIDVQVQGVSVAAGSGVNTGSQAAGTPTQLVVRLRNLGNADLLLSGAPLVQLTGLVNCSVTLMTPPGATIAPGTSTDATLQLTPAGIGPFGFDLSIDSNDADESPYTLHFSGVAGAPAMGGGNGGGGSGGGCVAGAAPGLALLVPLAAMLLVAGGRRRRRARQPR